MDKHQIITVGDLLKQLQMFDKDHPIILEIDAECGHLKVRSTIEDVQFKNMNCVLYGCYD